MPPRPRTTEIEERDQANNLVATYIQSFDTGSEQRGRFDVVVCLLMVIVSLSRALTGLIRQIS